MQSASTAPSVATQPAVAGVALAHVTATLASVVTPSVATQPAVAGVALAHVTATLANVVTPSVATQPAVAGVALAHVTATLASVVTPYSVSPQIGSPFPAVVPAAAYLLPPSVGENYHCILNCGVRSASLMPMSNFTLLAHFLCNKLCRLEWLRDSDQCDGTF